MAREVKKMNVALDLDVVPWLEIEAGRRGCSQTALINAALREQQEHASDDVKAAFAALMATREQQ